MAKPRWGISLVMWLSRIIGTGRARLANIVLFNMEGTFFPLGNQNAAESLPDTQGLSAAILSHSPLIIYSSIPVAIKSKENSFYVSLPYGRILPLGLASAIGPKVADRPATFILAAWWTLEPKRPSRKISAGVRRLCEAATDYRHRFPRHRLILACNTTRETELVNEFGVESVFLNHNFSVSESIFRPLAQTEIVFDAVYNARFHRLKRHFLGTQIDRVAYIGYHNGCPRDVRYGIRTIEAIQSRLPRHRIFNELDGALPIWLSADRVNEIYNSAAVGLCLSAAEGANYVSMEYMLSGLPIVSTPSRGGRDVFFDPDYCLIVRPDPRSVCEGVQALKARAIPREYIRMRTLSKVEGERRRFLNLLNEILEQHGSESRFGPAWPFLDHSHLSTWGSIENHAARILLD
jgi:hypothetical protein